MKSFAKFLPSKYFRGVLLSLVIGVVLIGGAYKFSQEQNTSKSNINMPILATFNTAEIEINKVAANQDSDSDGLKDWEEVLWTTDPKNPDTDKDKTKDGDEVKMGRNPLVPGPKDVLPNTISNGSQGNSNGATTTKLTPTDILAQDFFSKYVIAKQSGQTIDQATSEQIASSVLARQNLVAQPRQYTEGDMDVSKTSSTEDLKTYGNKVGEIIKKTLTWNKEEVSIIAEALEKNDPKILQDLDQIINGYQSFLDQLLKTEVPLKALETHLALVNSVSRILNSLRATKNVFLDPVSALVLFGKYPEHITSLHRSFIEARALFTRNNISYDPQKDTGFLYAHFADAIEGYGKK